MFSMPDVEFGDEILQQFEVYAAMFCEAQRI
jgi:hypothetical protein